MTQIFEIDLPPTANRMWRHQRGRSHKSPTYYTWLRTLGWQLREQRVRPQPTPCRASLVIVGGKGWKVSNDLDNRIKPLLDGLVEHDILEGDDVRHIKQEELIYIERQSRTAKVRCFVKLSPLEPTWFDEWQQ
jgi:Holliday junction resolvase RusA-like endonuclease